MHYFSASIKSAKPISMDINIQCDKNKVVALVGPSGSGKTTVLRIIAGLLKCQNGLINIDNQSWLDTKKNIQLTPQQRHVGLVFQDYALFPNHTALKNILLSLHNTTYKDNESYAREWLSKVNLGGLESRYPNELSGGQKQRVALARALARSPKLLLLDEPFSSVDHFTKKKLIRELGALREKLNIPIILVTHDLDEARSIADEICLIHHGKTLQQASVQEILSKPKDRKVAKLLGMHNIFSAEVKNHTKDFTLLDWNGTTLETKRQEHLPIGQKVDWLIPNENIVVHRQDRPSKGEKENPVMGKIEEVMFFGETTQLSVVTSDENYFTISVPSHVANRNNLAVNKEIGFSLLAEAIHIMQASKL